MKTESSNILYKYRDWTNENHKKILTNQELYIASPKEFDDTSDCRITYDFDLLDTEDKIRQYVNKFNGIEAMMFEDIKNNRAQVQKDWNENIYKLQDMNYGVVSLCEIWDSIPMWEEYAVKHTGFCVGFHEESIKHHKVFGRGGKVDYKTSLPKLNPLEDHTPETGYMATHTKTLKWKHEKEYRFFKLFHLKPPELKDRIIKLKETTFAEVNIGVNFPKDELNNISKAVKSLNVPLYKVTQVENKFRLSRERIL
jgi:hypothetical protein